MAQIDIFMTEKESIKFAEFLINRFRVRFVPEKQQTNTIVELYTLKELLNHISISKSYLRYFLLSDHWSKLPLFLKEFNSKNIHC
jgi:hypothetical protein